jgi:hypothetical protein
MPNVNDTVSQPIHQTLVADPMAIETTHPESGRVLYQDHEKRIFQRSSWMAILEVDGVRSPQWLNSHYLRIKATPYGFDLLDLMHDRFMRLTGDISQLLKFGIRPALPVAEMAHPAGVTHDDFKYALDEFEDLFITYLRIDQLAVRHHLSLSRYSSNEVLIKHGERWATKRVDVYQALIENRLTRHDIDALSDEHSVALAFKLHYVLKPTAYRFDARTLNIRSLRLATEKAKLLSHYQHLFEDDTVAFYRGIAEGLALLRIQRHQIQQLLWPLPYNIRTFDVLEEWLTTLYRSLWTNEIGVAARQHLSRSQALRILKAQLACSTPIKHMTSADVVAIKQAIALMMPLVVRSSEYTPAPLAANCDAWLADGSTANSVVTASTSMQ